MRTLKQTNKEINYYPFERKMTTSELMGRAINRLRFKSNIWGKGSASLTNVCQMVNDVRYLSGLDPLTKEQVFEGCKYREIFYKNYTYALNEFKALCWGDW
jgi:hypothetical protein